MHLSSCRQSGFGAGRITYMMCSDYCRAENIVGDQREDLIDIMLAVDDKYLDHCSKKKKPGDGIKKPGPTVKKGR